MKKTQKIRWTALGAKTSVAILVTAALLMLALSAVQSYYARLAPHSKWPIVGYVGVLCALLIFATYSVIAGWTLEYIYKAATNSFHGENLALIEHEFATFHNTGWLNVLLQAIFIFLTGFVVFKGVQNGIEKYSKILMPLLLVILVVLAIRSLILPGAKEGLTFLFHPDFSKITGKTLVNAMGQGFFSLSIGMGALITYGSYVQKNDNLTSTAFSVMISDTLVAVLAGLVIFPAAFTFGVKPEAGMELIFDTLPMLFNQMTGGYWFCLIFFILLAIAGLTSTIALLEVVVAYLSEELHLSRKWATVIASAATLFIGVFAALSLEEGTHLTIGKFSFNDFLDFLTANIMLPLGGLLIVIFLGWRMGKTEFFAEVTNEGALKVPLKSAVFFIIRYLAPLAILVVFISGLVN